jgi:hypothetical protein
VICEGGFRVLGFGFWDLEFGISRLGKVGI